MEPGAPLDLSGSWRAVESSGDLHHRFVEPEFRDDDWLTLDVPGHWRAHADLVTSDGPVLYRRAFTTSGPGTERRAFLVFDGVFYDGDVWLDSTYLGATQGYFFPHAFEVTPQLRDREDHVAAVEVGCATGGGPGTRRALTGVYADLDTNPGGIWRPVRVVETGPVRLARVRALCVEASEERGRIVVAVTLDAGGTEDGERRHEPLPARLTVTVHGPDGDVLAEASRDVSLAAGENHVSLPVDVEQPPRWWPRALGDQPLCDVDVAVDVDGERSDARTLRTAFRDVRMRRWQLSVNGEPMFVRGSTLAPARLLLATASPDELRRDVELARDANLDLVRVHGHVSRPELYDAADELGLLVWQDLPLRHRYARTARGEAVRQAREMVDLLGHRPSVVMWCAHDEPYRDTDSGRAATTSLFLPSWNKDVLDRSVTRALRRADATRPVERYSGVPPGPFATGSDAHLVGGWHDGLLDGLAPALRAFPRLARFVGAFGAPAAPASDALATPARWPDREWLDDAARGPYSGDVGALVPCDEHTSFAAWTKATRERQAALVQLAVEDVRRVRGRPAAGFCHFLLAGGPGGVSCAVVDDDRASRPAYDALRDACRPVLPMLDPRTGDVHVVNECAADLDGAVVRVVTGDGPAQAWTGDVAGRDVTFVGRLEGPLDTETDVTVVLDHSTVGTVENRYGARMLHQVARPPHRGALSMLKRASAG